MGTLSDNIKQEIRQVRKKYNLPERFVLYVGDVTWNKNLPRLVEAIKKTNIPLVMVGKMLADKDFDKKNLWNRDLKIVQENIKNNNQFLSLGFVSKEELVSLYNMAKVFVMPSLYEGFGLPILEAMRCGCPVITTKAGSLSEVVQDAACYVDSYSIESISSGIKEVFYDENLQRNLSKKGLYQADKFSWKKTISQTINVYETISKK